MLTSVSRTKAWPQKGKTLILSKFNSMMTQVYRENAVTMSPHIQISYHDTIIDSLEQMKTEMNDTKMENFSVHFEKYANRESLGNDDESDESKIDPEELSSKLLNDLENHLQSEIENMQKSIQMFMQNLRIRKDVIKKTLTQLNNWDKDIPYVSLGMFVKNYLYYLCTIVPAYIIDGNEVVEHKYPLLMDHDAIHLKGVLQKKYDYLIEFKNDALLTPFMRKASVDLRKMYRFLSKYHGFFPSDRESLYRRYFLFCLHFIFYYFITLTEDDNVLDDIFKHVQNEEEKQEADENDLEEIEYQAADRGSIQIRINKFIQKLLDTQEYFNRDKKSLFTNYGEIRDNVERLEDAEKKRMMQRFEQISEHRTRRAEQTLKQLHLGEYYVDPKVIKKYGARRDKMLDTEDVTEDDFLFRDFDEENEIDVNPNEDNNREMDDIFGEDSDEDIGFLGRYDEDDAYDIAENAQDRM